MTAADGKWADPEHLSPSRHQLEPAIQEHLAVYNENLRAFIWTTTAIRS